MSKLEPEVGDVWRNRDNEICYIVKVHKNASVLSNEIKSTYRIIEYTGEDNVNVMECEQSDLIEYLGLGLNPLEKLFEVQDDCCGIDKRTSKVRKH